MTRVRDIANILGVTEAANPTNAVLTSTADGSGGVTVYATKEDLPSSGLTSGDQAYVTANSRFYISNGSGWYNVALINATPSLTIDPTGAIELSAEGATTTITLTATDSDNAVSGLTYSVESDGSFAGLATISQDSSVFTITPLSEDSATTASAVLTFKASDGISFGSGTRTFTLSFVTVIENSKYTSFLAKADASETDNQVDASTNNHTITKNGNVRSTALSPYHPGGYSGYFTTNSQRIYTNGNSSDFNLSNSNWTYEGWFYVPSSHTFSSYPRLFGLGPYYQDTRSFGMMVADPDHSGYMTVYWNDGTLGRKLISATTYEKDKWNHVAVCREGNAVALFYNGTRIANNASYTGTINGNDTYAFVGTTDNTINPEGFVGYWKDVRLVKGSSVYDPTASSIIVPDEPLTAVTNTKLLLASTPYLADASPSAHSLIDVGHSFKRRGPYDYSPYTKTEFGGSVYFDGGASTRLTLPSDTGFAFGLGAYTVEAWIYISTSTSGGQIFDAGAANGSFSFLEEGGQLKLSKYGTGVQISSSAGAVNTNQWHHCAIVRTSNGANDTRLYVDGVLVGTGTDANNWTVTTTPSIGGANFANYTLNGYISDLRIVKGTAVYTSAFTPPTAPLTAIANTQLLTCTNKNDIWDASSGGLIVENGTVTASNTQRKFSTSSAIYHSGGAQNLEYYPETSGVNIGTRDFTVEFWLRADTTSGTQAIATMSAGAGFTGGNDYQSFWIGIAGGGSYWLVQSSGAWDTLVQGSSDISVNTWQHWAMSRNSGTVRYFLDGTLVGSRVNSTSFTNTNGIISLLGRQTGSQYWGGGYMQDFNYTLGLGKYTANFTPPTAEFEG
jgi:hypothetical protein